ncbi:MAG TPA: PA14 domain-containing protein [bacterium]|nr:PA14 domain-containing protein [bacterium]
MASVHPSQNPKLSLLFLFLFSATGQFFISQSDKSYTLWIGLLFYGLALWELKSFSIPAVPLHKTLPKKIEFLFFILAMGLGCFFRLYQIDLLPAGMHTDQGLTGLCALRIEHEGWRPFSEVFNFQIPEVLLFYQLAVWFHLAGDSLFNFHLFFVLQAMAAMVFFYASVRQLSGTRAALLSLFILAVTRWSWIETRVGYPSSEILFYLFGALCFWIYGLRKEKIWAWVLSALFLGIGLYTYQAFKLVPFLFVIYALFEILRQKKKNPFRLSSGIIYLLIVLAIALPLLHYFWSGKTFGNREHEAFIGTSIIEQKSLKPLWDVWSGNFSMFNRTGDENPRHNIPGHRMLDDLTGILFILGLGLAIRRWKNQDSFYALSGFAVLFLAGLLSNQPNNSNRLVILTAFVAFFVGSFLSFLWFALEKLIPSRKNTAIIAMGLILSFITILNFYTYFVSEANNEECRLSMGLEQKTIGQTISDLEIQSPGQFYFFITPFFAQNHVVRFLGYQGLSDSSTLDLAALTQGNFPKNKNLVFFLEENKSGEFELLKTIFPEGQEALLKNSAGHILLYRYDVPSGVLIRFKKWNKGLMGTYWNSLNSQKRPVLRRQDPVINFTSKQDFPFESYPPFFIQWKGQVLAENTGIYHLRLLTSDSASLWIDGKEMFNSQKPNGDQISLRKGIHTLRIDYRKTAGDSMAVHLIWETPGQTQWKVVPAQSFGKL